MAYSESLANRLRERLNAVPEVEEEAMMGGLAFMVNDKMCIGIIGDELMCRIDPDLVPKALEKQGCRQMDFTGRPMKSFVQVDHTGYSRQEDFDFWFNLCLEFNPRAKSS